MRLGINARFLSLATTGIGTMLRGYLSSLAKFPPQNTYLLFSPTPLSLDLPSNFEIIVAKDLPLPASFAKTFWEKHTLPRLLQKHQCDALWSPYPVPTQTSLPHLITVHDIIPWKNSRYARLRTKAYLKLVDQALHSASLLHFVSFASHQEFLEFFPGHKTPFLVIPNAANLPPISSGTTVSVPTPYLFYLGGYDPRKNVPLLVKLWAKYLAPQTGIHLVLGGQPPQENRLASSSASLRALVSKNLQDHFHLTGLLSEQEKFALYNHALAFVHLSSSEGFNLPLLEAISVGCPVAVSDIPVHHEVAASSAVYLPLTQERHMVDQLLNLIDDISLRKNLSQKSLLQAQKFSYDLSAEKLLSAFSDLLTKQSKQV